MIGILPLRAGSVGIPHKNRQKIQGKPLYHYALQAMIDSGVFTQIIVATDDCVLLMHDDHYPEATFYHRNQTNARNTSTSEDLLREVFRHFKLTSGTAVLVQATTPYVQASDFREAFNQLSDEPVEFRSLVSVVPFYRFLWENSQGYGKELSFPPGKRYLRQQATGETYMENGAFYFFDIAGFLNTNDRSPGKTSLYVMPEYTAIEIDESMDLAAARGIMDEQARQKAIIKSWGDDQFSSTVRVGNWRESEDEPQDNSPLDDLIKKLDKVKMIVSDVDGVLTDNCFYYDTDGDFVRKFNSYDGVGVDLLQQAGYEVCLLTSNTRYAAEEILYQRALDTDIPIANVYVTDEKKGEQLKEICYKFKMTPEQVLYIGNDIADLPAARIAGVSVCSADTPYGVYKEFTLTTWASGGEGVLREVASILLGDIANDRLEMYL